MDPYLIVVVFLTIAIGILACIVACEYVELRREQRGFIQDLDPD
jgi:hypothetical protein